jgi:DNA-binding response OmpR family regulator
VATETNVVRDGTSPRATRQDAGSHPTGLSVIKELRSRAREPVLITVSDGGVPETWQTELSRDGFAVEIIVGLEAGLVRARDSGITLIVVDLGDETRRGIECIRVLRDESNPAAILVATNACDIEAVVESLDSGADGCIDRTSSGRELVARLRALIRRRQPGPRSGGVSWTIADLRVDPATRSVFRNSEQILLGPREFAVLLALLRRRGRTVSRKELLRDAWRNPPLPSAHSVETAIRDLRRKLEGGASDRRYIVTVRSGGYLIPQ